MRSSAASKCEPVSFRWRSWTEPTRRLSTRLRAIGVTEAIERAKLARIVDVHGAVWGDSNGAFSGDGSKTS